ncbi:homeobox KN domain-containing protein [Aspergillus floccosus]
MSQYRELGEGSEKMAITYASGLPADHTQALPSFRELLPPHLHDEIESTSYFMSRQNARDRPGSAHHDLTSAPKLPMGEAPPRLPANAPPTPNSNPRYASRGPSPILPPIRDLQSLPDRGMGASTAPFPDARGIARPDSFPAPDFRSAPVSAHGYAAGPMGERRAADAYAANGGPPAMQNQAPFPYPGMAYPSDADQLSHAQQSNFGILGDSADSKSKRRRGNLPKPVTDILRAWFHEHLDHPYPSEEDKQMFMTRTGLTISQISNWFINARRRQLPALRNQMRNGGADMDAQRQSPFSDVDQTSESMPSPHQLASRP